MKNSITDRPADVIDSAWDLWADDPESELPGWIGAARANGLLRPEVRHRAVALGFRRLPDGREVRVRAKLRDTLGEVFASGAAALGEGLLPAGASHPLDILRSKARSGGGWSEPLAGFDRQLWLVLAEQNSRHFGIEFVLAIKINTKWAVATRPHLTPRQLLLEFGFDPTEFTLYRADSASPLPADTPLDLVRGDRFEAQKDGRYGDDRATPRRPRGAQTIEEDIELLREAGTRARLLASAGQRYVEIESIGVPHPQWPAPSATLLVAVPATYPTGGLDAFYVELRGAWAAAPIPRQQAVTSIDGRSWALVSWHYTSRRPWNAAQDSLATHIAHCKGFFLNRGVGE
jgi:hypothetical protein